MFGFGTTIDYFDVPTHSRFLPEGFSVEYNYGSKNVYLNRAIILSVKTVMLGSVNKWYIENKNQQKEIVKILKKASREYAYYREKESREYELRKSKRASAEVDKFFSS